MTPASPASPASPVSQVEGRPTLRWAAAVPDGIALAAGDVGVVATRLPAGAIVVARFRAPRGGLRAALACDVAARAALRRAGTEVASDAPAAGAPSPGSWRSWRDPLSWPAWSAVLVWIASPAVLILAVSMLGSSMSGISMLRGAMPGVSMSAGAVGWLTLLWLPVVVRMLPWGWQVGRVCAGRPSAQQVLHAAEHRVTDAAGLVCGATLMTTATGLAAALDAATVALLAAWQPSGAWLNGAPLASVLSGVVALQITVACGAGRGVFRPTAGLHRLMALARPAPSADALALVAAAQKSLVSSAPGLH